VGFADVKGALIQVKGTCKGVFIDCLFLDVRGLWGISFFLLVPK
jgi:hypothetical protein